MKFCPDCGHERPIDDFHVSRTARDGRQGYCRKHQKRRAVECGWRRQGIRGMTWSRFVAMKSERHNRCDICGRTPAEAGHPDKELAVDHDKQNGEVRGLLCNCCNPGIGMMADDLVVLRAAIAYLEANRI